jgi:hypothetical protein
MGVSDAYGVRRFCLQKPDRKLLSNINSFLEKAKGFLIVKDKENMINIYETN